MSIGVRYDDRRLAIDWPVPVRVIADRDTTWPLVNEFGMGIGIPHVDSGPLVRSSYHAGKSREAVGVAST